VNTAGTEGGIDITVGALSSPQRRAHQIGQQRTDHPGMPTRRGERHDLGVAAETAARHLHLPQITHDKTVRPPQLQVIGHHHTGVGAPQRPGHRRGPIGRGTIHRVLIETHEPLDTAFGRPEPADNCGAVPYP